MKYCCDSIVSKYSMLQKLLGVLGEKYNNVSHTENILLRNLTYKVKNE